MARKKTIYVDEIREHINEILKDDYFSTEYKSAVVDMAHHILHKTENYRGFMFNTDKTEFDTPGYFDRKYF